jgi:integrase
MESLWPRVLHLLATSAKGHTWPRAGAADVLLWREMSPITRYLEPAALPEQIRLAHFTALEPGSRAVVARIGGVHVAGPACPIGEERLGLLSLPMDVDEELPPTLASCLATVRAAHSVSRVRQLSWVASELAAFATLPETARRPTSAEEWFAHDFLTAYLTAADSGALRRRGNVQCPSPDATRRVRRACLRLLAATVGRGDTVPSDVALPALRSRVEEPNAARALGHWRGQALPADARPGQVRTAAMAVLIREASMRSGELAALVPGDLDLETATLTYQPRPPATRTPPPPRTVELTASAVAVLRHWMQVRAELTARTPRTGSLWVSVAANHDGFGVRRRPAGMPLRPTGLRRAHARAVAALNEELAGHPGFAPLPRTVGQFRGDET